MYTTADMAQNLWFHKKTSTYPTLHTHSKHRPTYLWRKNPLPTTKQQQKNNPNQKSKQNQSHKCSVAILAHHTHIKQKNSMQLKMSSDMHSRKVIISNKFTRTLENIIVPLAFIIGTAGSGKSLFTAAFAEWLKMSKQDVAVVNLDPGALKLPYQPDVDVRNYVEVGDIMEKYGLGPNGALVMAADLIADEIENLTRDIDEAHADIVLVDTPGQMELFRFPCKRTIHRQRINQRTKSTNLPLRRSLLH